MTPPERGHGLILFAPWIAYVRTGSRCGTRVRQTVVVLEGNRSSVGPIFDIHSICRRVLQRYLHRRIANDEITAEDIAVSSCADHDPVGIAAGNILLSDVVVGSGEYWTGTEQPDAEVSSLRCVSVSYKPVRTEPAAASAAVQSYAAARTRTISVPHGNVAYESVIGSPTDQYPRSAIGRYGYALHCNPHAVVNEDARVPKLLN